MIKQPRIQEFRIIASVAAFLACASMAAPALAGVNAWTYSGLHADSLAVAPSGATATVYAGVIGTNLFKLTTNGWEQVWDGKGSFPQDVNGIAFDAGSLETIYLAVSGGPVGGVYKTVDDGRSWQFFDVYQGYPVSFIAADPRVGGVIYAEIVRLDLCYFVAPGVPPFCPSQLFRSMDGGVSWFRLNIGGVSALAIDPRLTSTLYALGGEALFESWDSGTTWVNLSDHFGDCVVGLGLDISRSSPNVLYVTTLLSNDRSCPNAVYKTIDQGESWQPTALDHSQIVSQVGFQTPASIAVDPSDPSVVYVGTLDPLTNPSERGSLFRTIDGGETWFRFDQGLPDAPIDQIVIDRDRGVHVIVRGYGVFDYEHLHRATTPQHVPPFIKPR